VKAKGLAPPDSQAATGVVEPRGTPVLAWILAGALSLGVVVWAVVLAFRASPAPVANAPARAAATTQPGPGPTASPSASPSPSPGPGPGPGPSASPSPGPGPGSAAAAGSATAAAGGSGTAAAPDSAPSSHTSNSHKTAGAKGALSVDSTPWATIYVDGKKLGITPLIGKPLPAGKHHVRAVTEDGRTQDRDVVVEPGTAPTPIRLHW
jgi:hypothetical protein